MTARALQKLVHVGCRELGLDADTRHDLQLVATGKASMRDMTDAELEKVIEALKARGFKPSGDPAQGKRGRPAAKRGDVRYCHVLWKLLAEKGAVKVPGRIGLTAFVRARFEAHWGAVPIDIDAMTEHDQIKDVVDALKAMCVRAGIDPRGGSNGGPRL